MGHNTRKGPYGRFVLLRGMGTCHLCLDQVRSTLFREIRGSSQLIVDIFNNLSTVSGILRIIACS